MLAFVGAAFLLTGCAGEDGTLGMTVETTEMEFSPDHMSLVPGLHTITVENTGKIRHTFSINSLGSEVTVSPGETKTLDITVEPGTYRYVCRVLDHEGLGMHGVLRVRNN